MLAPVKKISIIAHKKDQSQIMELLQVLGVLQIEDWGVHSSSSQVIATGDLATIKFAIDFLERYQQKEKNLKVKILNSSEIRVSLSKIKEIVQGFDYQKITVKCKDLELQINQEKNRIEKSKEQRAMLLDWQDLDLIPDKEIETETTKTKIGIIPSRNLIDFTEGLKKITPLIVIKKLNTQRRQDYLVVTYLKRSEEKIRELFSKYDFKTTSLPEIGQVPKGVLESLEKEIHSAFVKIKKREEKAQRLARFLPRLKILYDFFFWQRDKAEAQKKLLNTDSTFSILGWIAEDEIRNLKKRIEEVGSRVEIIEMPIKEGETIPVIMKNQALFQPFESVTNIYGAPLPHEPDPTPLLAPFFIIFFGLSLSDAGYGLILLGLSLAAIKILRMSREKQGLLRLLAYGGVVTFLWGVILGGWFGIDLDRLPENLSWLSNVLISLRHLDPVRNPLQILFLSLFLGAVQILAGIGVSIYWKVKNKKEVMEILDDALWVYFILVILFWAGTITAILPQNLQSLSFFLVTIGVISLVCTQGRRQKNIFLKVGSGILSLYKLIGYLSDALSYSRLLALSLATGIIAMAVNMVAGLFKEMIPYFGWLIAILIIIGGHLFNLAISALGAFIHSGRLQFVEFFSKFMEGGGTRFKPFTKETKYIILG